MRYHKLAGLAALSIMLLACKKEGCTVTCQEFELTVFLENYIEEETDTVILRKYLPNNTFDFPVSVTTLYTKYKIPPISTAGIANLEQDYDWELYIPATSDLYRLSNITLQGNTSEKGDCDKLKGCSNFVNAFTLNGRDTTIKPATICTYQNDWTRCEPAHKNIQFTFFSFHTALFPVRTKSFM